MKYTDEILMAYADGELDDITRAGIERAMREDEALASRVAQHRALRASVAAAFAPVAREPVPQRLRDTVPSLPPQVTPIDIARAAREARKQPPARRPLWQLGGMAAALVIGVLAGRQSAGPGAETDIASSGGVLVAQGGLAQSLSTQLAASGAQDNTRIGVSFVSKQGAYCRSFTHGQTAGLACQEGGRWTLPVVAQAGAGDGAYRQASSMPAAVLEAIDERIAGETLDAGQEQAAANSGWRR